MELPRRHPDDVYLPDGEFTRTIEAISRMDGVADLRVVICYAFDFRTRMLPYWYADKRMAPCSVRTLADMLWAAGVKHTRVVLQQWTPNFKPSQALVNGKRPDIVMVSAMQVHAEPSFDLVRDTHRLGADRPLILAGGPKAIYEPTDYFELGPRPGIGADCTCTGEGYVLLDLLRHLLSERTRGETLRHTFERCRRSRSLDRIPGLAYLPVNYDPEKPFAISTGVQRLLRDLDEMPMPDAGYRLLEPPHKRETLSSAPCTPKQVGKYSMIGSVISTHGCKFNCSYCPIPAVNQRTWRHKSPQRLAAEIKHIHENFGIREFFSTDDNFFNDRQTVIDLMSALAETKTNGVRLGKRIRFFTEATQFDVYKNRDLLPMCRKAGLRAIWFGIEDITGELVKKGQDEGNAGDLFKYMCKLGIEPMVMMIHNDDQPLRSPKGDLSGVINQAKYVFDIGAVSYQCTYLGPAIGTRDIEEAAQARIMYKSVGGEPIPQAYFDGNHVVASKNPTPWERQVNVLRAYATFYNPINLVRVLLRARRDNILGKRFLFQIIGHIGLVMSTPKLMSWARKVKRGPVEVYDGLQPARIPLVDCREGHEIFWALEQIPSKHVPQANGARPSQSDFGKITQTKRSTSPTPAPTPAPGFAPAAMQIESIQVGGKRVAIAG